MNAPIRVHLSVVSLQMAASGGSHLYRRGTFHYAERSLVLLVVVRLVCVLNPFYSRLTYIYINMSLRYKRWEKEQMEKQKSKKESKKHK